MPLDHLPERRAKRPMEWFRKMREWLDDTRRLLSTDQEAVVLLAAEKGSVERT